MLATAPTGTAPGCAARSISPTSPSQTVPVFLRVHSTAQYIHRGSAISIHSLTIVLLVNSFQAKKKNPYFNVLRQELLQQTLKMGGSLGRTETQIWMHSQKLSADSFLHMRKTENQSWKISCKGRIKSSLQKIYPVGRRDLLKETHFYTFFNSVISFIKFGFTHMFIPSPWSEF